MGPLKNAGAFDMDAKKDLPALIVNPEAKKVKRKFFPDNPFWEKVLPKERIWVTRSPEEVPLDLAEIQAEGINRIAILGGDGTLQIVLTHLIKTWSGPLPDVIPLHGGTINTLCHNLGLDSDPVRELSRYVDDLEQGRSMHVAHKNLIRVTEQGARDHYGFTFANGVFFRAFADYYKNPQPGVKDAIKVTAVGLLSGLLPSASKRNRLRPIKARITHNQDVWMDGEVRVIAASALENPVLWFKPFPHELNGRPAFHFVANAMDAKEIIRNAWPLMRGRASHPKHIIEQVDHIEARTDTGYILDGEVYPIEKETGIRISIGPAVGFMMPAAEARRAA